MNLELILPQPYRFKLLLSRANSVLVAAFVSALCLSSLAVICVGQTNTKKSRPNMAQTGSLSLPKNAAQASSKTVASAAAKQLPAAKSAASSTASKTLQTQSFLTAAFNVYVRENPSVNAADVGRLKLGTLVRSSEQAEKEDTIAGKTGFWRKVALVNGKKGWVFGAFLKPFDQSKSERFYREIAAEKLKLAKLSFNENVELYDFLTRVQGETKTPRVAAEIGLWRLLALKAALAAIPVDKLQQSPYKSFTDANAINIVYSEPSGEWYVRSDRFWSLSKKYADLPIGEQIAWEAAQNSLPGECEGYVNCYLYVLRIAHGEYLSRYPKGAHAAEALKAIGDLLQPISEDADQKAIYTAPTDVSDRAEFNKTIAELRSIISRTGFYGKEAVLRQLHKIAEGYR